ncbi:MAG: serine/threonine-protein kinase [Gallionellaceae bacterium]
MFDLTAIERAFPELVTLQGIGAEGGQKVVFKSILKETDVVLKIIKDTNEYQRVGREIAAVEKLNSSYVPKIFEHGIRRIIDVDRYFLVEQFVHGQTYREILNAEVTLSLVDALELAKHLLLACSDFEKAKIVHRDIKPENIMRDCDGKIWGIDFGIARHLDMKSLTATGSRFGVGTIGYAAPEQFRNLKPQIDVRADLFSVGVVLYEALCGVNPYLEDKHDLMAVIRKMESQDLPALSIPEEVTGDLSEFICALASRFPSRRPQTAKEAIDWFEPIYLNMTGLHVT